MYNKVVGVQRKSRKVKTVWGEQRSKSKETRISEFGLWTTERRMSK